MKVLVATLLAIVSTSFPLHAASYHGIFTQTITESTDPLYFVGDKYYGQYWYESPTIDGTFFASSVDFPGENNSLEGLIFLPFSDFYGGWALLSGTVDYGRLVVSGGMVTSFDWSRDSNHFYLTATYTANSLGHFNAISYYDAPIYHPDTGEFERPYVNGTLTFDAPAVPDELSTGAVLLLALAFLRLFALERSRRLSGC